jgi:hypothetical protein
MTYVLCLIYVAIIYIRPGEIIPGWIGFPFLQVAAGAALVSAVFSILLRPRRVLELPNDWCFLGFFAAAILSNPAWGWFGGGAEAFRKLQPLLWFYLLIRLAVTTQRQLRFLMGFVVVLTLFQAGNGILQYYTGTGLGGSTAHVRVLTAEERLAAGEPTEEEPEEIRRVRGTGIFGDPNDLAMSLVLVIPFLVSGIVGAGVNPFRRAFSLTALGALGATLILTQSRGGMVGAAALMAAYASKRVGKVAAALALVLVMAVALAAGPSRLQAIDSSESSAQGRIQAWAEGLAMLRSSPILGVGYGRFIEFHSLVAHNSFVHTYAETGLIGGFFFIGVFYWFFVGNGAGRNVSGAATSRLALDLWASGVGVTVCAMFLSRQYSPVLFVPLVMGAARVSVERAPEEPGFQTGLDWAKQIALTGGGVIATYVAVRLLAVWSSR